MSRARRGWALPDLLAAITVLSLGLAPATWVVARAERLVAEARARERSARAAASLLVELEAGLACAMPEGAAERDGVALTWATAPGPAARVVATFRAPGRRGADSFVTAARCP